MLPRQACSQASPVVGTDPLSPEERLERGEVVVYPVCPFVLPAGDDRRFLLEQQLGGRAHKNISYDPHASRAAGFRRQSAQQADRLTDLLAAFSRTATAWLADALPRYARSWKLDRVSFRPAEEATRQLRITARNDLLHVDSFPSRPTNGHLILRLFVNINPSEPRVWVTSDPFAKLLERYGPQVGLPHAHGPNWSWRLRHGLVGLFQPGRQQRSPYDTFMLRFHDFLKMNDEFQERSAKRYWTFPPGACWLVFTDITSHAALRGRFALEHSYFVAPDALRSPNAAPVAILERSCGISVRKRAA